MSLRVALTHSEGKLEGLDHALVRQGFEVIRAPLIRTETLCHAKERARALLSCPWLLFTSPSAVQAWATFELGFANTKLGAVGSKTAQGLCELGAQVSLIAVPQHASGLAECFLQRADAKSPVGLPQGDRALPVLQTQLEASGFETRVAVIYKTVLCEWPKRDIDVVILASPSAVEALPEHIGRQAKLVALGPRTAAAIAENGWPYIQAEQPTPDALGLALRKVAGL